MNINWLSTICNSKDIRPICSKPFSLKFDNHDYAIATDGAVLCAVKTKNAFCKLDAVSGYTGTSRERNHEVMDEMLRLNDVGQLTTLNDLREWAGEPVPVCEPCSSSGYVTCSKCKGEGCHKCDHEGTVICQKCNGESEPGFKRQHGLINDVLVNRRLISRPFHYLQAEQVRVVTAGPDREVYFITDTWRVVVMPLRKHYYTDNQLSGYSEFNAWQ